MGKRKITRRQASRVEKNEKARAQGPSDGLQPGDEALPADEPGARQKGLVIACHDTHVEVEAQTGERHRCQVRADLKGLVAGDHVVWCASDPTGVIVARLERTSELKHRDNHGDLQPMAANIGRIFVVIAPLPEPRPIVIDRYLVAASAIDIEPVILLNKSDLLDTDSDLDGKIGRLLAPYGALGYQVIRVSTTDENLDELKAALVDCTSVFVGQAGVGKSSLVDTLLPDAPPRIGALPQNTGTHTGTIARLSHLPGGGSLIDSPGIREFDLWDLSLEEVVLGFRELLPYLGHCRFSNCSHLHEPGCAIIDALAAGDISQQRLDSYRHIVAGLKRSSI